GRTPAQASAIETSGCPAPKPEAACDDRPSMSRTLDHARAETPEPRSNQPAIRSTAATHGHRSPTERPETQAPATTDARQPPPRETTPASRAGALRASARSSSHGRRALAIHASAGSPLASVLVLAYPFCHNPSKKTRD